MSESICKQVQKLQQSNDELLEVMKDVNRITLYNSKASHREQTEIFERMRAAIKKAEKVNETL